MSQFILPENWIWAKLGDITEIIGGGTPSRDNPLYFQGTIPWATPTDTTKLNGMWIDETTEAITESGLKSSSAVLLPPATVLMTSRASIGVTAINRRPMCTNQGFANFICNDDIIVNEYLAYWLPAIKDKLFQLAGGTTFKEISKSTLARVEIPLPPLPEQRRIAAILREADEIRRLRRQANEKMQEITEALFHDMFGDPVTNPKRWKTEKLGDLVTFTTSGPRNWAMYYSFQGARFIRVQNLTNHKLNFDNMVFITPPDNVEASRSKVAPTDILFSITGVVGLVAVVPEDIGDAYVSQHVAIIRLKPDIDPYFVATFLAHRAGGQAQIGMQQYGQTKPGFGLNDIRSMNIFLPPISLQKQFAKILAHIGTIETEQNKDYYHLDTLYQSLLAQAFSGELTASWREAHLAELAQAAEERDHLLKGLLHSTVTPPNLDDLQEPVKSQTTNREELTKELTSVQTALYKLIEGQWETYFTATRVHEDIGLCIDGQGTYREELDRGGRYTLFAGLGCSLDTIRRELHFLARMGLVKELTLLVEEESGIGTVHYVTAYRSLRADDECRQQDLGLLNTDQVEEALV
ncbi:MAG: restriction endonuclease subunit S [Ktedonobacteraceae bacterium]|nr:restriction endonuclease subunit S [Ktedonobacteraceae bacterium]